MNTKLYILPELPYAYDALEPYISKEIMMLHHQKHHQAYVDNLNKAIGGNADWQGKSIEDLISQLNELPEGMRTAVRNNGGGHLNHSLFWQVMKPQGGGEPTGALAEGIKKYFGSFSDFKEKFNDIGSKRFGSGWVWLVRKNDGTLEVMSTPNQDSPITEGLFPIMGNDVWEHAYYLQYKNVRADYLKAWWNIVNWQEAEKRFVK